MVQEKHEDIKLTITLDSSGIRVDGPINNEMLSLYLLSKATDIVKAHNIMKSAPIIEKPRGGILSFARNKF